MNSQQTAIGKRAAEAVLTRVASAIENEMPDLSPDLVFSSEDMRMHRLEGMEEPVYVMVTVHVLSATEARRYFPGGDGDRDALASKGSRE